MKEKMKAFTEKHAKIWEFIKFVFTACSTTILYYVIFWIGKACLTEPLKNVEVHNAILKFLGYDENLGLAISYLSASFLSYVASYIMNRKVTFKSNSNIALSTFLFAVMVVVTTAFTSWFGTTATEWLIKTKGASENGVLATLVVPTVAMLIPFVWTFPFQKYVIYRNKKSDDDESDVYVSVKEETAEETAEEMIEAAAETTEAKEEASEAAEETTQE